MLVEDDKSLREIYGVRLLAEGYDIVSAGDGEEALAMAIKDRPQLIISDVMMPKISGFDMLDILRSTTETKNIKVIMMTALSSDEQRQRGEQLGADKYLVKSQVGIEDVVRAVHEVLGDKPNSGQSRPMTASQPTGPAAPSTPQTSPAPSTSDSTIPQPTAPFTGQRPANLGERIIQPLKDNPRVSNVDVSELMDKEFASNVQAIEDQPEPLADQTINSPVAPSPSPVSTPAPSVPSQPAAPIQSVDAVSVGTPPAPQPADDMALPTPATVAPEPQAPPVVTPPLTYEAPAVPTQQTSPAPQPTQQPLPPAPDPTMSPDQAVSVPERTDTPLTPPERS